MNEIIKPSFKDSSIMLIFSSEMVLKYTFLFYILINVFTLMGCVINTDKTYDGKTEVEISCIGPSNASNGAVYFHGLDSSQPSEQELKNRKTLLRIANDLNLRIAIPRGQERCGSSVCWGWSMSAEELQRASDAISESAVKCEIPLKNLGLIGFSNGGYLVAKLFRTDKFKDLLHKVSWGVAVGSGMLKGTLEPLPSKIGGKIILIVGKEDRYNFDQKQNYFNQLRTKSDYVDLVEFNGGHDFPLKETSDAITKLYESHLKSK